MFKFKGTAPDALASGFIETPKTQPAFANQTIENGVQTIGGFVVHAPLSPISEEDEEMPRWNQLPNDPDQDEEDEDDDDDDFEVRNSVFMRTKTKKFVKKEKTNSGGSLTESSD